MTSPIPDGVLVLRGRVLTFNDDPTVIEDGSAISYWEKGAVVVEGGKINAVGDGAALAGSVPGNATIVDYGDHLILPGFIDGHVHYPQVGVIASYGAKLIDWLDDYTFPEESRFSNADVASAAARLFLDELTRNGFTTAAVYCTTHPESVNALFEESEHRGHRMIAGKVLMDRNAPDQLCDTATTGYEQSKQLIEAWHGRGRNLYSITPRFAITSTPAQLEAAGTLFGEYDDVYVQSHVSEDAKEMEWVAELFPEAASYLDVYDRFGLLGPRALYGHGIHFSAAEIERASESGTTIVHCPTSNLFLGSGLFQYRRLKTAEVPIALGTDVGGGTSLSPFATMKAAYEIARFHNDAISPLEMYYAATLGSARALLVDDKIGRLAPGYEADITIIDLRATPLMAQRTDRADGVEDLLFALMILADDRAIRATYVNGALAHNRDGNA